MSLITAKNPDLFRAWLTYLGNDTPQKRTQAFFNSQQGLSPPLAWTTMQTPTSYSESYDEHN